MALIKLQLSLQQGSTSDDPECQAVCSVLCELPAVGTKGGVTVSLFSLPSNGHLMRRVKDQNTLRVEFWH